MISNTPETNPSETVKSKLVRPSFINWPKLIVRRLESYGHIVKTMEKVRIGQWYGWEIVTTTGELRWGRIAAGRKIVICKQRPSQ